MNYKVLCRKVQKLCDGAISKKTGIGQLKEVTLNGRKRKIQKADFIKVMTASGLSEKVINNIAKKFRRSIVKWLDLIEASFLPDSMKKEYKKLILSRVMALR